MRIILEIASGPEAGRRVTLRAGQVLRVGRTEWADWAVPGDARLSRVHFAVSTSEAGCFLEDLGSSNGTCLNERPIAGKVALSPGDTVRAGETVFRVHGDAFASTVIGEPSVAAPAAPPPSAAPAAKEVRYTVETCDSGITLCQGQVEEIGPSALSQGLARFAPVWAVFDFSKAGAARPDDIGHPRYLFDWLSPEVAAGVSPVLLAPSDTAEWPSLLDELWGGDTVVALFSRLAEDELLAHLHRSLRPPSEATPHHGGMLGLCWPSVLAILLAHHSGGAVTRLWQGVEAVLVELPDLPETWQLFGREPVAGWLKSLGFKEEEAPVEQAPEEEAPVEEDVGFGAGTPPDG